MEIYILKDIEKLKGIIEKAMADAAHLAPVQHKNVLGDKWKFINAIEQAILSQAKKVDMFHVKTEQTAEGNNPPYLKDDMGRGLLLWSSWGQALNMGKCKDGYLAFIPTEFLQSKLKEN
jgi:hypothetical protein